MTYDDCKAGGKKFKIECALEIGAEVELKNLPNSIDELFESLTLLRFDGVFPSKVHDHIAKRMNIQV